LTSLKYSFQADADVCKYLELLGPEEAEKRINASIRWHMLNAAEVLLHGKAEYFIELQVAQKEAIYSYMAGILRDKVDLELWQAVALSGVDPYPSSIAGRYLELHSLKHGDIFQVDVDVKHPEATE